MCRRRGGRVRGGLDPRRGAGRAHSAPTPPTSGCRSTPGAVKSTDGDKDSGAFQFGIWGDSFGFKLAVVSFHSSDSLDAVAAFYRGAMGQYGPVLDCSNASGKDRHGGDDKANRDKPVTCDGDKAAAGGRLFKVGVNRAQRVFQVKPDGGGAQFTLVRIEMRGDD